MDFVALIIFLALYYLRPQEWFSSFNALHPVQLLSVMAIWAMFQAGKLNPRELVRTPLDWLMVCYFAWTIFPNGDAMHTASQIEAVLLFYFVAVRSLDSIQRQKTFLTWWCVFMLIIAALALASEWGFDPLGSNDLTQGVMKGRLVLNLSVFYNPNSLAHSVLPVVPLIYFLFFWRRTMLKAGLILLIIPLYCIFLTQSKGAFLCGFVTLLATLMFGRSRAWQIVILIVAVGFGYSALYALPRMSELQHSKTDPAIQGRIAAFTYGMQMMQTHLFGIGLGTFEESFLRNGPLEKRVTYRELPAHRIGGNANEPAHELDAERKRVVKWAHYSKATHSAYNQNGAELGYVGLFLFVGILYCCIRTLVLMRCTDDDEERIRRALFATVVAYAVSSWMVDFCYRPTFFMFVAAISAFHRHLLRKEASTLEAAPEPLPVVAQRPWIRRLPPVAIPGLVLTAASSGPGTMTAPMPVPGMAFAATIEPGTPMAVLPGAKPGSGDEPKVPGRKRHTFAQKVLKRFLWTRLGIMDFIIILILTWAAIQYWKHLIVTM